MLPTFDISKIKALCLTGSGMLYPLHLGFLQAMSELVQDQIQCVAGVSGGSFSAFLYLVCANSKSTFQKAIDSFLEPGLECLLQRPSIETLVQRYGLFSTEQFENYFIDLLRIYGRCDGNEGRPSPHMTFQELYNYTGKHLIVVATDTTHKSPKYFNTRDTPTCSVLEAVRYSMTVPGIFALQDNRNHGHLFQSKLSTHSDWKYIDGAFSDGYPAQFLMQYGNFSKHEILGHYIDDPPMNSQKSMDALSFLMSQASYILSARVNPDLEYTIVAPLKCGEDMMTRFNKAQRQQLFERAHDNTVNQLPRSY